MPRFLARNVGNRLYLVAIQKEKISYIATGIQ